MAITKTQSVNGNGATLTLNGVVATSLLTVSNSYYRSSRTGAAEAVPTDTQGVWSASINPAAAAFIGVSHDVGVSVFYQANVAAGTHTITPEANTIHHTDLAEWASAATSLPADQSTSASTSNTSHTSRTTGTTGTLAQTDELVLICHGMAAEFGSANVGYTDPVSGFTTFTGKIIDDSSDLATLHAWETVAATDALTATFNWTAAETNQTSFACIATFKAASSTAQNQIAWIKA